MSKKGGKLSFFAAAEPDWHPQSEPQDSDPVGEALASKYEDHCADGLGLGIHSF